MKAEVNGRTIQVEVRRTGDPETDVKIPSLPSFDGVIDSIEAIAGSLDGLLKRISPQRASVELGVDIGVESGGLTALIVKGSGTATMKITLEWERAGPP